MAQKPLCKGSVMLGTACGRCTRCIEELKDIKHTAANHEEIATKHKLKSLFIAVDNVIKTSKPVGSTGILVKSHEEWQKLMAAWEWLKIDGVM